MKLKSIVFSLMVIVMMMTSACVAPPTSAPASPVAQTAKPAAETAKPAAETAAPVSDMDQIMEAAKEEGELISYGMSDDWVNLGNIWKAIEDKSGVVHTDTDMTSAEQITRLLAEINAPVMDMADIGYDFLGPLLDNNLAMTYRNTYWDKIPDNFKDPDGRWASAYWGAISFLVNTDLVENIPQSWDDLLKPEYNDQVCSRDPRISTYATASVLAAAYAHGGGEDNIQPGLDFFKELRDSGNLRQGVVLNVAAVQKGECPISMVYDFDGFAKRDATGLPLEVVIPSDGTVGMVFAQYISSVAPHPNAAKLGIDFLYSDEGQVMLAEGYAHPTRDVELPAEVAAKMLPKSAYGTLNFPKSLASFSAAVKNIVDGWNAILGATEATMLENAKKEGELISYGMSDDWVNLGNIWKAIEDKYGVVHTDTDMTSAEQITRLLAEINAPVMDMADIGYDFLGPLLENNLAMTYRNAFWSKTPDNFRDPDGRWASAYWGAISFLVNTDLVQNVPQSWDDLLKPEYNDQVCSRDPRISTYATASVLAAAYAHGGGEDNVQPGLDFFKELRDSGNLREGVVLNVAAVQKGECPISMVYDFDGFAKRDATGLPLEVVIPSDGTVGMIFAQYISSAAPHPNAAKLGIDFLFSDEGQVMLAQGYAHPTRDVTLPEDVAAKMLPESAYGILHFPTSLASFSAAVKNIVDGWNAIVGG